MCFDYINVNILSTIIWTFYNPLASWANPKFMGLDLAITGLGPYFSGPRFGHIAGLADLKS